MKLNIALSIACRTEELGDLDLETSVLVETTGITWQLELEEVIAYRAREAARNLARQISPTQEIGAPRRNPDFVPLADAIAEVVSQEYACCLEVPGTPCSQPSNS